MKRRNRRSAENRATAALRYRVETLEPRVLLAADWAAGFAPSWTPDAEADTPDGGLAELLPSPPEPAAGPLDVSELPGALDLDALSGLRTSEDADSESTLPDPIADPTGTARTELVVFDAGVEGYEQLADLRAQAGDDVRYQIHVLGPNEDGVQRLSELLADRRDLDAVHIVSHGNAGGVQLGDTRLDAASVESYGEAIRAWSGALADGADLLFYGCDLAASAEGRALVETLGVLTGADVAASTDATGQASLGGDWQLEHATGLIEAAVPFSTPAQQHWQGVLAYIEDFETWSPASAGTWETKDLSGGPFNVPADAVLEIAVSNGDQTSSEFGGVRAVGSSFDRSIELNDADTTGSDYVVMHVQADGASRIETYASDAANIAFTLLGYWNSGVYVETDPSNIFQVGTNTTWEDQSLSAFGVGAGEIAEILLANTNTTTRDAGIRTDGSTLDRFLDLSAANNGGSQFGTMFVQAGGTASANIEAYADDASDVEFSVLGYWSTAPGTYTEAIADIGTPSADATWDPVDLSAFGVTGDAVAEITLGNDQGGVSDNELGVRETGSSLDGRSFDLQQPDGGTGTGPDRGRMHVSADASSTIEFYHTDVSDSYDFVLTGYWSDSAPVISSDPVWLSTMSDVTNGGQPGEDTWQDEDLILIGDPNLTLGPTTTGTFSVALDTTLYSAAADLNATHYVTRNVEVGASGFALKAGDLLLSTVDDGSTFTSGSTPTDVGFTNNITVNNEDVFVFRPDTPGDYSAGTFAMLLDNATGDGTDATGISLIERDVTVGDANLDAGDFLYARFGDNDVLLFETIEVGTGVTDGDRRALLEGSDAGVSVSNSHYGVDVVEQTITLGDLVLPTGTVLLTTQGSQAVGSNNLPVTEFNVYAFDVSNTTLVAGAGNGVASASMFFDGSDVFFDTPAEQLRSITLTTPHNAAPTLSGGPYSLTGTDEDTTSTGVQVSTILGGLTNSDLDGDTLGLAVTTAAGNATWQYSTDSSDGSDGTWTNFGAVAGNSALLLSNSSWVRYDPDTVSGETASLTFHTWDATTGSASTTGTPSTADPAGGGGTTAYSSTAAQTDLVVSGVNDAPANTIPGTQTVAEETATAIAGISVADVDAGAGNITTRLQVANGVLNVTLAGAATLSAGANGSNDLTVQGTAADINATLAALTYTGNTDVTGVGIDTLTVTTDDGGNTGAGGALQDVDNIQIDITGINDAPTLVTNNPLSVPEEATRTITSAYLAATDVDNAHTEILYTLTSLPGGGNTVRLNGSTLGLGGTFTQDDIDNNRVTYRDNDDGDTTSFQFTISDGTAPPSGPFTFSVNGAPINDAPVNTVPGTQTVAEETATAIGGISVADVDAAAGNITTRLQVANGVLNVTLAGAATLSAGANGSNDLTVRGTTADINATLASLLYTGNADVAGVAADTLTVTTDDGGNTGSGGAQQDVDTIQIDITAVNDAPSATAPASYNATEQGSLTLEGTGMSIGDVDAGGSNVQATLSVVSGTLSVSAGTTGVGVAGSGSNSVTLTGSVAQINNLLAGNLGATASYLINSDAPPASDTLTLSIDDQGNTGSGGAQSDAANATINIAAVNDAPANTVPGTQTVAEETATAVAGISIADLDAGGANLTTRLQVTDGVLSVTLAGAATLSAGANGSNDLTVQGTAADINATLASLLYTGNADVAGVAADTLTVTTDDGGNTGSGGALQDADNIQIDITAVNDAPSATAPASYNVTEQVSLTLEGTGMSIGDVDAGGSNVQATLSVVSGTLTVSAGTTGVGVAGSGSNSVTLTGSVAQINNLLAGNLGATASYLINSDAPPASDTLTLSIDDQGNTGSGGAQSDSANATINITAVNDAPSATAPASYNATEQVSLTLEGTGMSIGDVDAGGSNVQATLSVVSGTLSVSAGTTGVGVASSGSNSVTLTGSVAQINNLLAGNLGATASYLINSDAPPASDTLTLSIDDQGNTGSGGAQSDAANATINIAAVNDAPANTVPGTQTVAEETATAIAGISIADVDAGGANLTTRLQVTDGVLNVTLAGAATLSAGANGSNDLTVQGTAADINATLAALTYTGNTDVTGVAADTLTVTTDDGGNTGSGGPLQDADNIQIDIAAVNDAPSATAPGSYNATEQVSLTLEGTGMSIGDVDAGGSNVQATLSVVSGTLTVSAGTTGVGVAGSGSNSVTLTGSVAQINNLLAGNLGATASYLLNSDAPPASDTLTLSIDDQGNTGSGGAQSDAANATIDITPVNDAPANTVPGTQTVAEETATAIAGISIADVDAGGANLTTRLQVTDGVLNVTLAGAATLSAGANGSNDLTVQGTAADINATLAALTYTGNTDVTGVAADTLTVTTDDGGNTGSGGPLQDADNIQIDIAAVNDAPSATAPGSYNATEQVSLTLEGTGMSIGDVDAGGSNVQATLSVVSGTLSVSAGTTGVGVAGSGSNSVTLTGSVAQINNLLAGNLGATASYLINSDAPPASDTLTLSIDDQGNTGSGGAQSDSANATINIAAVNDVPVNTVPGTQTVAEETATAIAGISVADVDAAAGNITTRLQVANGVLNVTLAGAATLSAGANGSNDLTVQGTAADINATLAALTYTGNADVTGVAADTLTVTTDDGGNTGSGGAQQDVDNIQIDITPVNDEPSLNLLGDQNVNEDSGPHTVVGFATSSPGGGADEAAQTFSYTVSNDNPSLFAVGPAIDASGQLTYALIPNANGVATVTVSVTDSGGTANGGDDTSPAQNFTITVSPVNDSPAGTDMTVTTLEDTAYVFSMADFGFSDPVEGDALLGVEITTVPGAGTLTNNGLVLAASDTVNAADIATGRLVFSPATGASGAAYASFTFRVQDTGGTAAGGVDLDPTANRLTIDVTVVPDPHVLPPIPTPIPPPDIGPDPDPPGPDPDEPPLEATSPDPEPAEPNPPVEISTLSSTGGGSGSLSSTDRLPVELDSDAASDEPPQLVVGYTRSEGNASAPDVPVPATPGAEPGPSPGEPAIADGDPTKLVATRADITLGLDRMRDSLDEEVGIRRLELGQSTGVAVGLSVGYVSWLLRGGVLLSSVLSSLPAWRFIDPLPVFSSTRRRAEDDDDDGESLEAIVEGGAAADSSTGVDEDEGRVEQAPSVTTSPDSKQ